MRRVLLHSLPMVRLHQGFYPQELGWGSSSLCTACSPAYHEFGFSVKVLRDQRISPPHRGFSHPSNFSSHIIYLFLSVPDFYKSIGFSFNRIFNYKVRKGKGSVSYEIWGSWEWCLRCLITSLAVPSVNDRATLYPLLPAPSLLVLIGEVG